MSEPQALLRTLSGPASAFAPLPALVLDSLSSEHSLRAYRQALDKFFAWYQGTAAGGGSTKSDRAALSPGPREQGAGPLL